MGCGGSKQEDVESKTRNDAIENQLKKDRMNMRCVFEVVPHTDRTLREMTAFR